MLTMPLNSGSTPFSNTKKLERVKEKLRVSEGLYLTLSCGWGILRIGEGGSVGTEMRPYRVCLAHDIGLVALSLAVTNEGAMQSIVMHIH